MKSSLDASLCQGTDCKKKIFKNYFQVQIVIPEISVKYFILGLPLSTVLLKSNK